MRKSRIEAAEVFRQFAWNLAGKLAVPKSPPPRPRERR